MGKPRHSDEYYAIKEHYKRSNWEDRKYFVQNVRPKVARQQRLADKSEGWLQDPHSSFKSPFERNFHADHEVAINEAFKKGGYKWTEKQKKAFTYDLSNLKMIPRWTNIEKGAKNITKWLPSQNVEAYLKRRETTETKYGLTQTPKASKQFEKIMKRKSKTKVAPSVENTLYCTRCHINHSIGKHK